MTARMYHTLASLLAMTVGGASLVAQQPGDVGIEAAQRGGVVLACRHGITGNFDENEMTLRYEDPATQRQLTAAGERQSEAMALAFRALGISFVEVVASPMQRARRTAELAFGEPRLDSTWHTRGDNYGGPRRQRRMEVLARPIEGGNRVIVSHVGTLASLSSAAGKLEEGDCIVVRPKGGTAYEVVDMVSWRAWLRAAAIRPPER